MTKPKVQTRKVWVVLYKGSFYDNYRFSTAGKTLAKHYLVGLFPKKDGFDIVRATLTWPKKEK